MTEEDNLGLSSKVRVSFQSQLPQGTITVFYHNNADRDEVRKKLCALGFSKLKDRNACKSENLSRVMKSMPQITGRHTTVNEQAEVIECGDCQEWMIAGNELEHLELQAVVVTFNDAKPEMIGGPELKTARQVLGYTQAELADVLGCTAETLSGWETVKKPLSASIRRAMLGLALSVREES
jgi:DNA-binding XRE family transcriptional regulator